MAVSRVPSVGKEFLKLFSSLAGITLLIAAVVILNQEGKFREGIELEAGATVAMERQILETSLSIHLSDAVLLSDIASFHVFSEMPRERIRHHLVEEFKSFAAA